MDKFYADDNYVRSEQEEKPNIFLFGGILISSSDENGLIAKIKEVKSKYCHPNLPIKWNIKDNSVYEIFQRFNRLDELEKLKQNSKQWRKRIFQESLNFNYRIFFSCLENYQAYKKDQKPIKEHLTSYMFVNTLMRVALFVRDESGEETEVILDWPADSNPKPFNDEYYRAYNNGKTTDGVTFLSGPLKNIYFHESVLFSKCTHSTMLQFCDLIVGAMKEFLEAHMQNKEMLGKELIEMVLPKFYGFPRIFGYGVNVSTQNAELRKKVREILKLYVA